MQHEELLNDETNCVLLTNLEYSLNCHTYNLPGK